MNRTMQSLTAVTAGGAGVMLGRRLVRHTPPTARDDEFNRIYRVQNFAVSGAGQALAACQVSPPSLEVSHDTVPSLAPGRAALSGEPL